MSIDAQSRYHRYNSPKQTHGGTNNMPVIQPHQQQQQQQSGSNNSSTPIMSSSQRFCLRWNNHQSNLLSVFDQLLQDESFVDVTLAVEGQLLRAHKMVLSACSPYFQALFVSHPDKHPIVILKDVPYIDMRSLLDFMYRGEVSVDQDRLTAFLRVAESLRIKGLTEVNEDKCDLPSITSSLLGSGGGGSNINSNSYHQRSLPSKRPSGSNISGGNMGGAIGGGGQMMGSQQAMSPSMLGNALAQPKRKRGRPRKFSGSSNGTPSLDGDNDDNGDSPILRGTPELLEVKMNVDGFQGSGNEMRSETDAEGDDADAEDPLGDGNSIVKEETQVQDHQPMVGTSREQDNYSNNEEYHSENHHHLYLENNQNHSNIQPSVTFQLLPILPYDISSTVKTESVIISRENLSTLTSRSVPVIQTTPLPNHHLIDKYDEDDPTADDETTGVHFLTDDEANNGLLVPKLEPNDSDSQYYVDTIDSASGIKSKVELLEYVLRDDGTVMCKVCGQILASRTHWYRHKYKVHIVNPSPLFKCTKCNVFFKSRRGYIGHLHSRHPKQKVQTIDNHHRTSTSSIETDLIDNNQTSNILIKKSTEQNNSTLNNMKSTTTDWEIQREKEEKLVADIIDRVKKECEAQGTTVTRRGYSRRQTIMNS